MQKRKKKKRNYSEYQGLQNWRTKKKLRSMLLTYAIFLKTCSDYPTYIALRYRASSGLPPANYEYQFFLAWFEDEQAIIKLDANREINQKVLTLYLKLRIDGAYILHSQSTKSFSFVTKDNLKSTNNLLGRKKMCVSSFEIEAHACFSKSWVRSKRSRCSGISKQSTLIWKKNHGRK